MYKYSLNGQWQFKCVDDENYLPVNIPGSVLSGLIANEAVPDPFYRTNEYAVRELFRKDYVFEKRFEVTKEQLSHDCADLVCLGLDTICEVYINDELVAETDNFHRTYRFEAKDFLREGDNAIRVICKSPIEYMESHVAEEGKEIHYIPSGCMKNDQYIRKPHCMFGWDWGAQLPDAGIWRDIFLEFYSDARLGDVVFKQEHIKRADGTDVRLTIEVPVSVFTQGTYKVSALITGPDGIPVIKMAVIENLGCENHTLILKTKIDNAALWWPNNLGAHPLYSVDIALGEYEGGELDCCSYRIGLRTLTVCTDRDEWGSEFAFCVNGVKFFAMGADYIPEDTVYSRIDRKRIEYLVKSAVKANYNTLRVWGGGYYPGDDFYDLCDENGIVVWQDLMYACNVYELSDEFKETIAAETADNVIRLRHHASLILWCGNNEMESGWSHWYNFCDHSQALRADYLKMFEVMLPEIIRENDAEHFYWPSSPSSGGWIDNPDDPDRGDVHYWEVWHGEKPFTEYRKFYFRFCSEFGFQSFPSMKTIETFAGPEDMNIFSRVMESHQKSGYANAKILHYISQNFRYPKDFESVIYISQVLQGMAIKYGVEHWRRNRGRCMGSLYWQINDSWPVASWSSVDYFGRWKALMYMSKVFYSPVTTSICAEGTRVEVWLHNETFVKAGADITISLKTLDFEVIDSESVLASCDAFDASKVFERDYAELLKDNLYNVFLEVRTNFSDGRVQTEVHTFAPVKHMELKDPEITTKVSDSCDNYCISLSAKSLALYVMVDFEGLDAVLSDNYFHITDKLPVNIYISKDDLGLDISLEQIKNSIRVISVRDSYE
ncbi:MAG: glycoside hydrolase family 2 protein [Lachnospiraceae bacterium]|nr:glycoside hydrolase family 2 protein [Lachnospiraceae bacterium]